MQALGLSSAEFWMLTPAEFDALQAVWQEREHREDRRTALLAQISVELQRDPKKRSRPFELGEFILHEWPKVKARREEDVQSGRTTASGKPAMSWQQQMQMAELITRMMGGRDLRSPEKIAAAHAEY